jgi:mRNA interferase MazF
MAISSRTRPRTAFAEVKVRHWKEAGLLKPSVIKPVIATIERGLIRRTLGHFRPNDIDALRTVLGTIIGP